MRNKRMTFLVVLLMALFPLAWPAWAQTKPRIAVFSGPNATMQNTAQLVTSNEARKQHGLPLRTNPDSSSIRFDHLVPQRLATPVQVLIEQYSAHPLERDAAELYGPPDGYVDRRGVFHETRQGSEDTPVYQVTLRPEDGLYLLPYMAVQADGRAWEGSCASSGSPPEHCRQAYFPDAARLFEEIDRGLGGLTRQGTSNMLSSRADFDFYRGVPPGGYTKGLAEAERTDAGSGDIPPEVSGEDWFPAGSHRREARMEDLARAINTVQQALRRDIYSGAIWFESSHTVQETTYWLNLLIDTQVPISGNASQRPHRVVGNDGDRNVIDSVDYILSKVWANEEGKDEIGAVVIQDEQIFASRQVEKQDARPGRYRATGEHGGVLGSIDPPVVLWYKPTVRHTWNSAVNLTQLPSAVQGVKKVDGRISDVRVPIKDDDGLLLGTAIPKVTMVRYNHYIHDNSLTRPEEEVEILARIEKNLRDSPLSGLVAEGTIAAGRTQESLEKAIDIASLSGMPVVRVSRGDEAGRVRPNPSNLTIEGSNLTAAKARLLLMAALMKFGSLPRAVDPENPTQEEKEAVRDKVEQYQEVFNTH